MTHDPIAKGLRENVKISPEALKDIADSVVSIKVQGLKPLEAI